MACALGNRLYARKDMTANALHTLKPQSIETLALLSAPLDVEVLINPKDPQVETVETLFDKYRTHKADLNISFNDPALDPQRMRQLDVAPGGEIFLRYQNRTQRLTQLSESSLTSAMQKLARANNQTVLFTTGHGERSIDSKSNADLGIFAQQLKDSGFTVGSINLSEQNSLETNDGTLVIAGPLQRFLTNEVVQLLDYVSRGGNLIWLTEPASDDGLKPLAIELGIERLPGVVIDMAAQQLKVERPDFAIATSYFRHQATEGFTAVTLFPQSTGLNVETNREWQVTPLVQSGEQAWTETGQQRVVVAGDGDFLADAWIANGGNRELGNRLFNWNVADTAMIGITAPEEPNMQLNLSRAGTLALIGVALLLLPGLMFSAATGVWYRRQHG